MYYAGESLVSSLIRTRTLTCTRVNMNATAHFTPSSQLEPYIADARQQCVGPAKEMLLIGNKTDDTDAREVTTQDGLEFAEAHGLQDYREVSAKSGANVKLTFRIALSHAGYRAPLESERARCVCVCMCVWSVSCGLCIVVCAEHPGLEVHFTPCHNTYRNLSVLVFCHYAATIPCTYVCGCLRCTCRTVPH